MEKMNVFENTYRDTLGWGIEGKLELSSINSF